MPQKRSGAEQGVRLIRWEVRPDRTLRRRLRPVWSRVPRHRVIGRPVDGGEDERVGTGVAEIVSGAGWHSHPVALIHAGGLAGDVGLSASAGEGEDLVGFVVGTHDVGQRLRCCRPGEGDGIRASERVEDEPDLQRVAAAESVHRGLPAELVHKRVGAVAAVGQRIGRDQDQHVAGDHARISPGRASGLLRLYRRTFPLILNFANGRRSISAAIATRSVRQPLRSPRSIRSGRVTTCPRLTGSPPTQVGGYRAYALACGNGSQEAHKWQALSSGPAGW
jgi:hypothetical protein